MCTQISNSLKQCHKIRLHIHDQAYDAVVSFSFVSNHFSYAHNLMSGLVSFLLGFVLLSHRCLSPLPSSSSSSFDDFHWYFYIIVSVRNGRNVLHFGWLLLMALFVPIFLVHFFYFKLIFGFSLLSLQYANVLRFQHLINSIVMYWVYCRIEQDKSHISR